MGRRARHSLHRADGPAASPAADSTSAGGDRHPAQAGAGRLLEFAEQEATRRRLTRLSLYTNEVMTESQAVYTRLGYREVRRATEHGYHRIFMIKDLAAGSA